MRSIGDRRLVSALALGAGLAVLAVPGCTSEQPGETGVAVGLFLSYSGHLAAHSINSERALMMALEAVNAASGVGGQPLRFVPHDTRSDPHKVADRAQQLVDAGVAVVIGPETSDLLIASRSVLDRHTVILPSFATASGTHYKAPSWFVLGAPDGRMACELIAQLQGDGRQNPLLIHNPTGYDSSLAWILSSRYGLPKLVLPTDQPTAAALPIIMASAADSFVLAAVPSSATSLVFDLLANGAIRDPSRWYFSPTLHSPVFLEPLPGGTLVGARGVSQGTTADAPEFRARFVARWDDEPLDDAYPFYDAGALAALALERALTREGAIPTGTGLSKHLVAITRPGGTPIRWNELDRGLAALRRGDEVTYLGLSGPLEFDILGQTAGTIASWWTIAPTGFAARDRTSNCQ